MARAEPSHPQDASNAQEVSNAIHGRLDNITEQELVDTFTTYRNQAQVDANTSVVKFIESMPSGQFQSFINIFNTRMNNHEIVETSS